MHQHDFYITYAISVLRSKSFLRKNEAQISNVAQPVVQLETTPLTVVTTNMRGALDKCVTIAGNPHIYVFSKFILKLLY